MQRINLARTVVFALAAAGVQSIVHADQGTFTATDNSTITTTGPRSGANNQKFIDTENGTGTFGRYAVVDFDSTKVLGTATAISGATLQLVENNAAFTTPGLLNIYLTQDTATGIDFASPQTSPLTYDGTSLPDGLGTQLSTGRHLVLGGAAFTTTGAVNNGQVDSYQLNFNGADITYLLGQLNSGGDIRLIVAPGDGAVSATWGGLGTAGQAPQLILTGTGVSVPEPASAGLLACGALALLGRRRIRIV